MRRNRKGVSHCSVRLLDNTDNFQRHNVQLKRKRDRIDIEREMRSSLVFMFDWVFPYHFQSTQFPQGCTGKAEEDSANQAPP